MVYILIYNSQFADYIFDYTIGFFYTESADLSDKSLIHHVKNSSAPAEALALANMSRHFKIENE